MENIITESEIFVRLVQFPGISDVVPNVFLPVELIYPQSGNGKIIAVNGKIHPLQLLCRTADIKKHPHISAFQRPIGFDPDGNSSPVAIDFFTVQFDMAVAADCKMSAPALFSGSINDSGKPAGSCALKALVQHRNRQNRSKQTGGKKTENR